METALVTGATRGVGRGVAISLAESGFKVFATGRHIKESDLPPVVTRIPCDHLNNDQTDAAFSHVTREVGSLDVLINCCWGGYERMVEDGNYTWRLPFWEQPGHRWISMMDAGVRAGFVCAAHAARMMLPRRRGLIVNLSYWGAQRYLGNAIYGVAKAATDKMTGDMAHELRPHGVTVISLYPGLGRTESVMAAANDGWLDLSNSESPEFIGRVVAVLAREPALIQRTGQVLIAAAVAVELGVRDIDGRQPTPLTLEAA